MKWWNHHGVRALALSCTSSLASEKKGQWAGLRFIYTGQEGERQTCVQRRRSSSMGIRFPSSDIWEGLSFIPADPKQWGGADVVFFFRVWGGWNQIMGQNSGVASISLTMKIWVAEGYFKTDFMDTILASSLNFTAIFLLWCFFRLCPSFTTTTTACRTPIKESFRVFYFPC